MSDLLLDRLREVTWGGKYSGRVPNEDTTCWYRNPEGPEAADEIERLRDELDQEIKRHTKHRSLCTEEFEHLRLELAEATRHIEKLESMNKALAASYGKLAEQGVKDVILGEQTTQESQEEDQPAQEEDAP